MTARVELPLNEKRPPAQRRKIRNSHKSPFRLRSHVDQNRTRITFKSIPSFLNLDIVHLGVDDAGLLSIFNFISHDEPVFEKS